MRNRNRSLFCSSCLLRFERVEAEPVLIPGSWIALRCPGCQFEVFSPYPQNGYNCMQDSLIRLGARTYVLHTPPGRANTFS